MDLAEVRAFELLRPEYDAAITGAVPPEDAPDTRVIEFLVRRRDDAADRLADAIEHAREAGVPESFLESVVGQSEKGARFGWPFPS